MAVSNNIGRKIMYCTLLMISDIERNMIAEKTETGRRHAKAHNLNYSEGRKTRMQGKNRYFYKTVHEYLQNHYAKEND